MACDTNEESNKPYHLDNCQVLLPPKVFPDIGSQCCQTVVSVHDHVDSAVDERKECIVSSCTELESDPNTPSDESMMYNVKDRDVSELLPENEENSVQ